MAGGTSVGVSVSRGWPALTHYAERAPGRSLDATTR